MTGEYGKDNRLQYACDLEKCIGSKATKKKQALLIGTSVAICLWAIGFVYIVYLSTRYPTNILYYMLVTVATSEGIVSTALIFLKLNKTWDQSLFATAREEVIEKPKLSKTILQNIFNSSRREQAEGSQEHSTPQDHEKMVVSEVLRAYFTEINDPVKLRTKEMAFESLKRFCNALCLELKKGKTENCSQRAKP